MCRGPGWQVVQHPGDTLTQTILDILDIPLRLTAVESMSKAIGVSAVRTVLMDQVGGV